MKKIRPIVWPLITLIFAAPSGARADGWQSFDFPDLEWAQRQVINPYVDYQLGLTFTALPIGGSAETGLVRSNASPVCLDAQNSDQMLGTAAQGSGDIGSGGFPIRVDFAIPVAAPAVIEVTIQTTAYAVGHIELYGANNTLVGVDNPDVTASKVYGTCLGEPSFSAHYRAVSQSPVAYVIIRTEPGASFVIDNFSFQENQVATVQSTWGRVKALYR